MFKKGDYIVLLNIPREPRGLFKNYIYEQNYNQSQFSTLYDTNNRSNGWSIILSTDTSQTLWRYATKEEIFIYKTTGKPFDTSLLPTSTYNDIITKLNILEDEFSKK